jgi:hypothetical protein
MPIVLSVWPERLDAQAKELFYNVAFKGKEVMDERNTVRL